MAKKHKHEEHENHERWVISYADMVTLLFALFVVLYALGEIKLSKLEELKRSLAFAFHFEGAGQTQEPGIHDKGEEGGDLIEAAMLLNPQKGPMKQFLLQTLPEEFEEITGRSLEIVLSDDTVAFVGPLSAFFVPQSKRLRPDVHDWLADLVGGAREVASDVRVRIEAPQLVLGKVPRTGEPYYTGNLCHERLMYVRTLLALMPDIAQHKLVGEFVYSNQRAGSDWEDVGTIAFAFSNPDR